MAAHKTKERGHMHAITRTTLAAVLGLALSLSAQAGDDHGGPVKPTPYKPGITMTKSVQAGITPSSAIDILKAGNARFIAGKPVPRKLKETVTQTALGQFPFASVVACIDSRSGPETVFDQSVGDLFVARVAGNTVNEDRQTLMAKVSHYLAEGGWITLCADQPSQLIILPPQRMLNALGDTLTRWMSRYLDPAAPPRAIRPSGDAG